MVNQNPHTRLHNKVGGMLRFVPTTHPLPAAVLNFCIKILWKESILSWEQNAIVQQRTEGTIAQWKVRGGALDISLTHWVCLDQGCWPEMSFFYRSSTFQTNMTCKQTASVSITIPVRKRFRTLMLIILQDSGNTLTSNFSCPGGEMENEKPLNESWLIHTVNRVRMPSNRPVPKTPQDISTTTRFPLPVLHKKWKQE